MISPHLFTFLLLTYPLHDVTSIFEKDQTKFLIYEKVSIRGTHKPYYKISTKTCNVPSQLPVLIRPVKTSSRPSWTGASL